MNGFCFRALFAFAIIAHAGSVAWSDSLDEALATIHSAKTDGSDSLAVGRAWQRVATSNADNLPRILAALDGASPLGANYLRTAIDSICERQLKNQRDVPRAAIERFVLDRSHDPRARHLAYQWLVKFDSTAENRLLPNMADDPSVDLRRGAVARLIQHAEKLAAQDDPERTVQAYQTALRAARDQDQVKKVAAALKKLGEPVDLPKHFGFITQWRVIAPFDNTNLKGFDAVYPPERELNAEGRYPGKDATVTWRTITTQDEFGMVDLNKPFGRLKEVVGYAWAQFESPREQQVELRLGCKNAWKLWVNGELIFERNEYHRGTRMDHYRFPVTLRPGSNDILLKVCQNEMQETWTEQWEFQLRVCDSTGTAILPAGKQ